MTTICALCLHFSSAAGIGRELGEYIHGTYIISGSTLYSHNLTIKLGLHFWSCSAQNNCHEESPPPRQLRTDWMRRWLVLGFLAVMEPGRLLKLVAIVKPEIWTCTQWSCNLQNHRQLSPQLKTILSICVCVLTQLKTITSRLFMWKWTTWFTYCNNSLSYIQIYRTT